MVYLWDKAQQKYIYQLTCENKRLQLKASKQPMVKDKESTQLMWDMHKTVDKNVQMQLHDSPVALIEWTEVWKDIKLSKKKAAKGIKWESEEIAFGLMHLHNVSAPKYEQVWAIVVKNRLASSRHFQWILYHLTDAFGRTNGIISWSTDLIKYQLEMQGRPEGFKVGALSGDKLVVQGEMEYNVSISRVIGIDNYEMLNLERCSL